MIALAATGPLVIRLCLRRGRIGSAAGTVYALSTAGSMAGILATSFFLLPHAGTHTTLKILCAVSFAVAGAGLITRIRRPILAILPAVLILSAPDLGWSENTVWTGESAYNLIRVIRQGTRTTLVLNHSSSIHTVRDEAGPWTGYYYDKFALGPVLVRADRALVLGMGAGGSIHSMRTTAPQIIIDAVEIDPKVVLASTRWFGIDTTDPRLHTHVADARPWLLKDHSLYDLVQVDLYQGGPYVPFYLITEEFFGLVRAHMTGDSLLMMNVFDVGSRQELLMSTAATLRRVFPCVMVIHGSNGNHMLLAFGRSQSMDELRARVETTPLSGTLRDTISSAAASITEIHPPASALVFTDDHAPVEEMTRRMLAEFRGEIAR